MKTRISMTISKDLLGKLDSLADGVFARSRSEAIEKMISRYVDTNRVAVFLGGGDLDKLKIDGVYRPLVKINGRHLIEYSIDRLIKAGFRKIFFVGQSDIISDIFKVLGNGEKYNIDITYIQEKKTLGNAKTLQLLEKHISS